MGADAVVEIRYTRSDGLDIAYAVVGQGPIDVVLNAAYVSHLQLTLDGGFAWPRLARFARVILFDKRGTGLSDRTALVGTLEERIDDVRAVMDAAESKRAALVGISEGGAMSVMFAATHPERVSHLVLWASFARSRWAPDYPSGGSDLEIETGVANHRENWGRGLLAHAMLGEAAPAEVVEASARNERLCASPSAAARLAEIVYGVDVRVLCPSVAQPVLVLHRTGDPVVALARAHDLAARFPRHDG